MSEAWSTEKIREAFIYDGGEAEYYDPISGASEQRRIAGGIFDRWLAAYTAEKQAEVLEQAAREMQIGIGDPWNPDEDGQLRRNWRALRMDLFARARRLREQATNQPDRSQ